MRRRMQWVVAAAAASVPSAAFGQIVLNGDIRDFVGQFQSTSPFALNPNGHPHFEIFSVNPSNPFGPSRIPAGYGGILGLNTQITNIEPGIVGNTLDANRNPIWVGGTNPALFPTTKTMVSGNNLVVNPNDAQNAANFNQWYNDAAGVNQRGNIALTLAETAPGSGLFSYSNDTFFPLDNGNLAGAGTGGFTGFGTDGADQNGAAHNYHFTIEAHTQFTFVAGQQFTFNGDDDVWVFINDKLALDMGGVHQRISRTIDLSAQAAALGISPGGTYNFDFFFAERNTVESHFRIDTTIASLAAPVPPVPPGPPVPPVPPGAVPLPAGVWMGLSTLGAIGLARLGRRRKVD